MFIVCTKDLVCLVLDKLWIKYFYWYLNWKFASDDQKHLFYSQALSI